MKSSDLVSKMNAANAEVHRAYRREALTLKRLHAAEDAQLEANKNTIQCEKRLHVFLAKAVRNIEALDKKRKKVSR